MTHDLSTAEIDTSGVRQLLGLLFLGWVEGSERVRRCTSAVRRRLQRIVIHLHPSGADDFYHRRSFGYSV
jgi:hypothetical protein